MIRLHGFSALFFLLAALVALPVRAEVPVPPLQARVTDLAGTLAPEQRTALERKLAAFEQQKGSQLAVLIVPTTRPETIEQYSIRVAEQWKLGRKGVDDGALLVVAKDDRELRIEVGYGLEGPLPDAIAKRIVSEVIVPRFRDGDFYGGIDAGVSRMISAIEGEPLPIPRRAADRQAVDIEAVVGTAFLLVVAVGSFLRAMFGRLFGGIAVGGITGIIIWLLFSSLILAGLAGLAAFVVTLLGSAGRGWHSRGGRGGWPGGGGWGGGGWSGGGGGWSGGGGGFGGGGASGRW
ncbi:MAG TPA: YgcG family protein [Burkholderiales bacterium]|nr:YgcG family protein [Burkholderiales bacterium]